MPKIKRQYYRRAKVISDSAINIVQNCNSVSLESESNNVSLCKNFDCVNVSNYFSLKQNVHSINYQLNDDLNNLEQVNSNFNDFEESNDVLNNESINHSNSYINEVNNTVNNIFSIPACNNLTDNTSNFQSWLQEWAIKNRISHVALNELVTGLKPKHPELPSDARSLLRNSQKSKCTRRKTGAILSFRFK